MEEQNQDFLAPVAPSASFAHINSSSPSIDSNSSQENSSSNTSSPTQLRRSLGFGALFLITLNAIFASSLTYLPGLGVALTGPSSILMWVVVFAIGMYIALCLSELIGLFPKSGNIYIFAKKAYGHFTGFIVGWISWLAGNIVASLSVVWALEYLWPQATFSAFLIKLAIGIGIIILLNAVVFFGMDISTFVLIVFSVITLVLLFFQIVPFFFNIQAFFNTGVVLSPFSIARFTPFFLHKGLGNNLVFLFATLFLISEAFFGLESITFLSKETKNPARVLPKALITAVGVVAVVMLLYVFGSIGFFDWVKYASASLPHKEMLSLMWSGLMEKIMIAGTGLIIIAPAATWVVTGPRLLADLATDKLFLESHAQIHKRWKTPFRAIRFQAVVISLLTAFIYYLYIKGYSDPYKLVHEVFLIIVLFMLSLVVLSVPVLRKKLPSVQRPFKAPGGSWGPYVLVGVFILIISNYVILTSSVHLIFKAFSLIFLGVPIFLLLILYYNPDVTRKAYSSISWLIKFFEPVIFPKRIRKKILNILSLSEGSIVFEYGSSVGTFTFELSKKVGLSGRVHAVDFSKKNISLLQKRAKKKNAKNIFAFHDEHLISRVHPSIPPVHAITSIGTMDHIQDLEKVLEDMANILPDEGKIVMVEYVDFFGVLPNSGWLSDLDRLKKIYRDAGFAVKITKWRGFFWNYIVISGIKTDEDVVMI